MLPKNPALELAGRWDTSRQCFCTVSEPLGALADELAKRPNAAAPASRKGLGPSLRDVGAERALGGAK